MPLPHLTKLIKTNDPILQNVDEKDFEYTSCYIVGLGFKGKVKDEKLCWVYYPD